MESFIFNFTSGTVQSDGEHIVVPVTMIVPGVLNGSRGPLLYPLEEIANSVDAWDDIPILINHPPKGQTALDVIGAQGVGRVKNPRIENERLRADLFFEHKSLNKYPKTLNAVVANEQIEVSTGLGTQNEEAEKGSVIADPIKGNIPYIAIARNFKPDHLAILSTEVGACSIADGCGVNNKLSDSDVQGALRILLQEANAGQDVWIEELYTNEVIFSSAGGEMLRSKYTRSKDKVILSTDPPVKVQRVTSYKTINTEGDDTMKFTDDQRTQLVEELISNSCCWEETDREELKGMTDNMLSKAKQAADKQSETEGLLETANSEKEKLIANANQGKTKEEPKVSQTPETVLSTEDQAVLNYGREMMDKERQALMEQITVNVSDDEKPNVVANFKDKTVEELRQIAAIMPKPNPTHNVYPGQPFGEYIAENAGTPELDQNDILIPEDIDFVDNSIFAESK